MSSSVPWQDLLRDRITLQRVPFSDRSSRLMLFREGDALRVRLAERWFKLDSQLSSYRTRPPILSDLAFEDERGNRLALEQTTWPHRIEFRCAAGTIHVTFVDPETLLFTLPPARIGITFRTTLDSAVPDRRGGTLRLSGDIRRNIAYSTNARLLSHDVTGGEEFTQRVRLHVDASEGGCAFLLNITPRLGFNRWIPPIEATFAAAERRWNEWFAATPAVRPDRLHQYLYAWWVMRAGLISTRFYTTREAMTPSKVYYVGVWQWDAYFHALAYRHIDPFLARDQLRIVLDHQRADGMIPDAIHDEGVVTHLHFPVDADVTKPPLLAWTAWKLYEADGDREFLDEVYEPIVRWNRWWFDQNDRDGSGLCEYGHPFSSGLDDSPMWDQGMPVEAPDLNTYLVLQMDALARIARVLGMEEAAAEWEARAATTADALVATLWDAKAGLFLGRHRGESIPVRTAAGLLPILTGRLPEGIVQRLVETLTDPQIFWTHYPVPSVAIDEPTFDPLQMWRGPTWLNINALVIEGLFKTGHADVARELRSRTLDMAARLDDIYEYYHPQTGEAPPKAAPIFGWSAALFIEMAIQEANE